MARISICLGVSVHGYLSSPSASLEDDYQTLLKTFFSQLYSMPSFLFSLAFSSELLSFLEKKHPESIEILRELYSRRQVEFLGSAFHDSMLPLVFPIDRSAQVEKMNSMMRSLFGKRPRGMFLPGSIWDYSLVTSLNSCGMEYLELDSTLVPSASRSFYPLITGGMGKSLKLLPVRSELVPDIGGGESPEDWISRIKKAALKFTKNDESPVVVILLDLPAFKEFLSSGYLEFVSGYFQSRDEQKYGSVSFTLPQLYLKGAKTFIPAYIPAGMDWRLARWSRKPYESCENKSRFPLTMYDYLNCYNDIRSLYDRMMYISMLLAQGHGGDKVLKNLAKDKLWEAQSMFYYASFPSGMPVSSEKRQEAFRLLNDAELLIRQGQASRKGAKELEEHSSIISYDYDRNGINEYVCSLRRLRLVITRLGAQIVELDNVFNGCNYASSPSRLSSFDESTDAYTRGFFAEHFFTGESLAEYGRTLHSAEGDSFASILFDEKKLDVKRNEITFSASCCLGASRVPVELIKKYTVLDDGISIQCILRNDGQEALKGFFVSESNFAQTDFSKNSLSQYSCELVLDGDTRRLDSSKPFMSSGGASALRVTDGYDKMQFNFVPNEEAGFIADLISFRRPDSYGLVGEDSRSLVTAFFWEIDLAPGRSVEKNINFSVTAVSGKKKRISPSL